MKIEPARLHILPAKRAPIAAVIRRKPSKRFHILRWDTSTDEVTSGSWFRGKLYPLRSDISFNGNWLTYLALGASGDTWNGICRLPWLKTVAEGSNNGTWFGGGYWFSARELRLNNWKPDSRVKLPFRVTTYMPPYGEDEGVLYQRMERDGWMRVGPFGKLRKLPDTRKYRVECVKDPGWSWQPSRRHPVLRAYFLGYFGKGREFLFNLPEYPAILDAKVQWACWDSQGSLLVARDGAIARYSIEDLATGRPSFFLSLDSLDEQAPASEA